ncbi:hypothetical protein HDU99_007382, partial [Rhizoclosmatium hyalinum]
MLSLAHSLVLLLVATPSLAGSFKASSGSIDITFTGTIVNSTTVQLCATATPLRPNTYISIGIPENPKFPRMLGSDFYVVSPSSTGSVHFLVGIGSTDPVSSAVLVPAKSRYNSTSGTLTACFTRRVGVEGGDGNVVVVHGKAGYIWATGLMVPEPRRRAGWIPVKHAHNGK